MDGRPRHISFSGIAVLICSEVVSASYSQLLYLSAAESQNNVNPNEKNRTALSRAHTSGDVAKLLFTIKQRQIIISSHIRRMVLLLLTVTLTLP